MKEEDFVDVTRSENQEAENGITIAYDDAVQEYQRLANQKENQISELEKISKCHCCLKRSFFMLLRNCQKC